MLYTRFYSELGKLLYAVAYVDGNITQKERDALHKMVKSELLPLEEHSDSFGSNAASYAEFEFDFLEEQEADAVVALESFLDFVSEHRSAIDEKLKDTCLRLVNQLATAYHGTNQKEAGLIATLKQTLESIKPSHGKQPKKA